MTGSQSSCGTYGASGSIAGPNAWTALGTGGSGTGDVAALAAAIGVVVARIARAAAARSRFNLISRGCSVRASKAPESDAECFRTYRPLAARLELSEITTVS